MKKGKTVLNALTEIINLLRKPDILWVFQGREFCIKIMQEWSGNNILMYLENNEGKSVIAECL